MLLSYLGAVVGVPISLIPQVHLLGLSLALVGATFVGIGILTALVLGVYGLSGFLRKRALELVAFLFLVGLVSSLVSKPVSYGIYFTSSALFLMVRPKR